MRDERSEIVRGAFISKVLTLQKGQMIVSDETGFVVEFVCMDLNNFSNCCACLQNEWNRFKRTK